MEQVFDLGNALDRILSARPNMTLMQVFGEAARRGGWHGDMSGCPDKAIAEGLEEMAKSVSTVIECEAVVVDADETEPID